MNDPFDALNAVGFPCRGSDPFDGLAPMSGRQTDHQDRPPPRGSQEITPTRASDRSVEELLHHWRAVIGEAPKGFPRDFALAIQKARRRPAWQPTDKQLAIMRRMVAELFTHLDQAETDGGSDADGLVLIERE
jgi:hypothetical protein